MKSSTDEFWNSRPSSENDQGKVNISDTVQRDHELQFVFSHLASSARLLEVGCGNGYVSQQLRERVAHVDSFDYAENMVTKAKENYGEKNNRFFHDSILAPKHIGSNYDVAICIRVLINLRNLSEQKQAVLNVSKALRPGGKLILIEGYRDGFEALSAARKSVGLPELAPAAINFYSHVKDLMPTILDEFQIEEVWHSGMFDFLTRLVYPQLVGAEKATGPSDFHSKIEPIVRSNSLPDLARYARLIGFALARR